MARRFMTTAPSGALHLHGLRFGRNSQGLTHAEADDYHSYWQAVTLAEFPMRKSAAILMAVGALTLSGAVAHADTQSPAPTPPRAPKCLTFGDQPPQWHHLPCGWTTDGKRWTPPPPPNP